MTIDIADTIRAMLLDKTSITGITSTRIYTDFLPQRTPTPAIVLWANAENAWEHLEGPVGMDQAFMRINSYAPQRSTSVDLAAKVWQELAGFRGVFDSTHIREISRRSGLAHTMDRPAEGTDQRRFVAVQDLLVSYYSLCEV